MSKTICYASKTIDKSILKVDIDEENSQYKSKRKNKHDTTLRKVLMNKKEASILINKALKLNDSDNKITPEDIELYNNRFVSKSFYNKETDVIYKMTDREIYFLIEHQSTVDYNMPRRILQYKAEIISQSTMLKRVNSKKIEYH